MSFRRKFFSFSFEWPYSATFFSSQFAAIACRTDGLSLSALWWLKTSVYVAKQERTFSVYKSEQNNKIKNSVYTRKSVSILSHAACDQFWTHTNQNLYGFVTAMAPCLKFSELTILIKQQSQRTKPIVVLLLKNHGFIFSIKEKNKTFKWARTIDDHFQHFTCSLERSTSFPFSTYAKYWILVTLKIKYSPECFYNRKF